MPHFWGNDARLENEAADVLKQNKRQQFFSRHPWCAFCGGMTPATEVDHVPSRQFFFLRHWPEDFEFPACERCNRRTKDAEQLVAFIARSLPDVREGPELAEFKKIVSGLANNYPEALREFMATKRQTGKMRRAANALKAVGIEPESVSPMNLSGPHFRRALKMFATKLFLSLHYRETRQIRPHSGGVAWKFYSNFQRATGDYPDAIYQILLAGPKIQRNRADLSDQFNYSFRVVSPTKSVYAVHVRKAFAMMAYACHDVAEARRFGTAYSLIRPFDPDG